VPRSIQAANFAGSECVSGQHAQPCGRCVGAALLDLAHRLANEKIRDLRPAAERNQLLRSARPTPDHLHRCLDALLRRHRTAADLINLTGATTNRPRGAKSQQPYERGERTLGTGTKGRQPTRELQQCCCAPSISDGPDPPGNCLRARQHEHRHRTPVRFGRRTTAAVALAPHT
jgi:hypothetical protein